MMGGDFGTRAGSVGLVSGILVAALVGLAVGAGILYTSLRCAVPEKVLCRDAGTPIFLPAVPQPTQER